MPTTQQPTRLQQDLREESYVAPGVTALVWAPGGHRHAWTAPAAQGASIADCTCPVDCPRDHETD